MNTETFESLLTRVAKEGSVLLSELHRDAAEVGSGWSADQLRLGLASLGLTLSPAAGDDLRVTLQARSEREVLAEAILEVVRAQGGRPIAVAQVRQLLPERLATVTSVEQIRAIARDMPELQVFGPGLLRLKA
jgi:hypothetical protein